jgi:signal transduction histidine kinase
VSDHDASGTEPVLSGPARALLDAVTAISGDLDLRTVLSRIVEAATELTGARYGALGVLGTDRELTEFVTVGISPEERSRIGPLPRGRGILGVIIDHPASLRLERLDQHPASTGFPPGHPAMTTFLGTPVRIRGTVFGNLYLTDKEGGTPFTDADEQLVEALARTAGYVVGNARAYGLSERRRQWLEASAELAATIQPPVTAGPALEMIARAAVVVAGAHAVVVVPEDPADEPTVAGDGASSELVDAVVARVHALGDPSDDADPVTLVWDGLEVVVVPFRTHLVPVRALAAVLDRRAGEVTPMTEDHELLASFTDQAALSLDRAQAVQDREELALVSERDRIARDLHDVVIQRLFATGLRLQGVAAMADDATVAQRLDEAAADLDVTIQAIRGTIFELQHRQEHSLRAEVRTLVREYVGVLGWTPTVRTSGPVDSAVPERVRIELIAVLREAVSNVARHALADSADVELRVTPEELVLVVTDDGAGVPSGGRESGLRNARRRAANLDGTLEVAPAGPRGTRFTWRVPLV